MLLRPAAGSVIMQRTLCHLQSAAMFVEQWPTIGPQNVVGEERQVS
jgi:hypothetical protein